MSNDTLIFNFFSIYSLISFFTILLTVKYSKFLISGSLLDKDFVKPQAFHKEPTARAGGLALIFLFCIFITSYYFIFNIFLIDYLLISLLLFSLGFLDDAKIYINPNVRLIIMILILLGCINIFSIQIRQTGLEFLNMWLENYLIQSCFVLLCFLFIINGSNMIDGFNGLLGIHFLIINSMLLVINLINFNESLSMILIAQNIIVFSFLLFNFPRAKIFLGDSGSYFIGSIIVINTIKTHELNVNISPFFFTTILFYLFYEVFFSFIRKLRVKSSPLMPDDMHLHMLVYKLLHSSKKFKNCNYLTSILINVCYFFVTFPVLFFINNPIICRYWFLSLILFYTATYYKLFTLTKK